MKIVDASGYTVTIKLDAEACLRIGQGLALAAEEAEECGKYPRDVVTTFQAFGVAFDALAVIAGADSCRGAEMPRGERFGYSYIRGEILRDIERSWEMRNQQPGKPAAD